MSVVAAVALGSNLGSNLGADTALGGGLDGARLDFDGREGNLRLAVERVGALGRVVKVSTFYDTAPVGVVEQPRFLNGALLLETELGPVELLRRLLDVERGMGRDRAASGPKGPRVIDLDLLLFGEVVIETEELTVPHPALRERRFVLEPLAEIAGGMVDPVTRKTVGELFDELEGEWVGIAAG